MINFINNYFKFLKDVIEMITISLKNLENISKLLDKLLDIQFLSEE